SSDLRPPAVPVRGGAPWRSWRILSSSAALRGKGATMSQPLQHYAVHIRDDGRHHGHVVEGSTFEDAAIAYIETWSAAADADGEVVLIVQERESGRQLCVRIDLTTGETG